MDDKLLTVSEVGRILGVRRKKVYRMVHQENMPHLRLGRTIRIRESSLYRWLDDLETVTELPFVDCT